MSPPAPSAPFLHGFERLFDLSEDERDHLHQLVQESIQVPPRRKLVDAGKVHEQAFILKAGWMIEFKMLRDGGRQILDFKLPGEVVGIDSLAYAVAPHSSATLTQCEVARLPREALLETHGRFPKLAAGLFLMSLREEAILHQWELSLGRRSAYQRTAHLIAELHCRAWLRGLLDGSSFPFPVTQQDLADCLGLTPPYVNRILRQLRDGDLVRIEERRLEVMDVPKLAQVAGFDPAYLKEWGRRGRQD